MSRSNISKQKVNAVKLIALRDKVSRRIKQLEKQKMELTRLIDKSVKEIAVKETPNVA